MLRFFSIFFTLFALFANPSLAQLVNNQPTPAAQSPELNEVSRLVRGGQFQNALDKANGYLSGKPKDPLARFLKGVALTELGRSNDAIVTFQALTEDYPELPEPYNNLAVLFASKGQFEKARAALELAIQTHPSYATAHENLGDVYAKLASQAYDKALQLDKANNSVQSKLSLVRDLFSTDPRAIRPVGAAAKAAAPVVATATVPTVQVATVQAPVAGSVLNPNKAAQLAAQAAANSAANSTPLPAPKQATTTPPAPVVTTAATPPAAAPSPSAKAPASSANDKDQILTVVNSWAGAWSSQDVDGYLAQYSERFKPQDGVSRDTWAQTRRERISAPKKISVKVNEPTVTVHDDGSAEVSFKQSYSSDTLGSSSTRKTLVLIKSGGQWKISRERAG